MPADVCPIIEGLMMVRLDAPDEDHPAIDAAIKEIERLRAGFRTVQDYYNAHMDPASGKITLDFVDDEKMRWVWAVLGNHKFAEGEKE